MSSNEIEDVLSSIRRLVSEDFRPQPKPQIVSAVAGDKLILTPALRVVSSAVKPLAIHQVDPAKIVSVPVTPMGAAAMQPSAVLAEPVRVASDQTDAVPPPVEGTTSAQAAPIAPLPTASAAPINPAASMPRLHLGAELEIAPTTSNVVATLSQAVDRQSGLDWEAETGDPEPDMSSLDWSSFTFARRSMQESWIARNAAIKPVEPVAAPPMAVTPEVIGPDAAPDHIEFHDQRQEDVWQGDETAGMVDGAGPVFAEDDGDWAEAAEAEVIANLDQLDAQIPNTQAPQAATAAEVLPGVAQEEDNIFSEQVLRELVRDLIREQLQGDLGERITRNIRKLVKAEIASAMAVRALE